jgi:acyl carrier protein
MNEHELHDLVIGIIADIAPDIDPAALDPNANFFDDLDLDSMDFLNMVVKVSERTGIEIPERDYPRLGTLDEMVSYLALAPR